MKKEGASANAPKRDDGARLLREGRFAEAAVALAASAESDPSDATSWRLLGGAFASQGDYERAARAFQRATELAPTDARNNYNLGLSLEALDQIDRALSAYSAALRADPGYAAARTRLEALGGVIPDFESAAATPDSFISEDSVLPTAPELPPLSEPKLFDTAPSAPTAFEAFGFAAEPSISAGVASADVLVLAPTSHGNNSPVNNSGTGEPAPPEVASGWNWGAFYLSWLWLLNHKRVGWGLGLLALALSPSILRHALSGHLRAIVTVIHLAFSTYLGLKGNEIGWKYRRFQSVADFKACQKSWAKWSLAVFLVVVVLSILAIMLIIALGILAFAGIKGAAKVL